MNNKTQRRPYENLDISGAMALGFYERTFKNLATDAENSLKRPWHKLERGLRIGRIREFVSREAERLKLDAEDTDALFKLLTKALDRKLLNSKSVVIYRGNKGSRQPHCRQWQDKVSVAGKEARDNPEAAAISTQRNRAKQ